MSILNSLLPCIFFVCLVFGARTATADPFEQCLYVESSVCLNSGQEMIGKDNKPDNLLGFWTFDDMFASDYSGMKNFVKPAPAVGPAAGGRGYSAYFNGTDMSIIEHIAAYEKSEFTLSFSVFLLPSNLDGWRSLVYKGSSSTEMTPAISLWPKDTRLHVRVSTDKLQNEGLDSVAAIPLKKWTQITITYSGQLLQLYINGMLDSQVILQGAIIVNKGPFYLGKDPYHAGTPCYIDNLKFYEGRLQDSYLMAESSAPQYVVGGDFYVVVGCQACNYNEALNSCPDNYHLCSLPELYSGGYQMVQNFEWLRNNRDFWYRVTDKTQTLNIAEQMLDPNIFKLGLCCIV